MKAPPNAERCLDSTCQFRCLKGFRDTDGDLNSPGGNGCECRDDQIVTVFEDSDHDGFGGKNHRPGCESNGWTVNPGDCDDNNASAHPGQTAFFASPRSDGTYDYNCDGKDELRWPIRGRCSDDCKVVEGWAEVIPPCGASADFITGCEALKKSEMAAGLTQKCKAQTDRRTQECR